MADRTSAALFCTIFKELAADLSPGSVHVAHKIWPFVQSHDFNEYQMNCDDALIKLGLARMGVNPLHPEDGEVVLYGPL
jgi:hypothetical protein